ncbi:unnamed protein product [Mytilus coruscus]|uniref:Uncharacterized protein n=1 Tax=Mytilus coruscus TaxID=42192 RepID=A0A6J8ERP4_MYTCO|nr:unnamed protein product [Mytilus coruscus]
MNAVQQGDPEDIPRQHTNNLPDEIRSNRETILPEGVPVSESLTSNPQTQENESQDEESGEKGNYVANLQGAIHGAHERARAKPKYGTRTHQKGLRPKGYSQKVSGGGLSLSAGYRNCQKGQMMGLMRRCDECREWFHGRFVNINPEEAEQIGAYQCPGCSASTSVQVSTVSLHSKVGLHMENKDEQVEQPRSGTVPALGTDTESREDGSPPSPQMNDGIEQTRSDTSPAWGGRGVRGQSGCDSCGRGSGAWGLDDPVVLGRPVDLGVQGEGHLGESRLKGQIQWQRRSLCSKDEKSEESSKPPAKETRNTILHSSFTQKITNVLLKTAVANVSSGKQGGTVGIGLACPVSSCEAQALGLEGHILAEHVFEVSRDLDFARVRLTSLSTLFRVLGGGAVGGSHPIFHWPIGDCGNTPGGLGC